MTSLTVVPYSGAASTTTSSAFTPTGCSTLAYGPKLAVQAAVKYGDGSTQLTSTISQNSGEAATKQMTLTMPSLTPRSDVQSRECAQADVTTCPATSVVGSATAVSPLSANALTGKVIITKPASSSSSLPGLAVVFPAPFPIVLTGTTALVSNTIQTTFAGMPDVPLTSTTVMIAGGSDSMFVSGWSLCANNSTATGAFTGQNGGTSSTTVPVATTCSF